MIKKRPDISLEQAIAITKKAGIKLNYDEVQTVAGDIFQLKQDIKKQNAIIESFKWIFVAIVIASVLTTLVLLADYAQFASKAYNQFTLTVKEQSVDHKTIEAIQSDIGIIKEAINQIILGNK